MNPNVLSKRKPSARRDKIALLNASRRVGKARPKNFIPDDDIRPLMATFLRGEPVEGEVAVITREQAKQADYSLSPSRWVRQAANDNEADLQDIGGRFEPILAAEAAVSADLHTVLQRLRELA